MSGIDRVSGLWAIKPSGVDYDALTPADIVVLDLDGKVVDGKLRPSSDTKTHLYLYREFPHIGGVTHTHSMHATMFCQAGRELPCLGTTHADHFYGTVPLVRALTPQEVEADYEHFTGVAIVERLRELDLDPMVMPAVLLLHHAPFKPAAAPAAPKAAPVPAAAKPADPKALVKSGDTEMKAGDFAGALAAYQAADAVRPTPELAFAIAECHDKLLAFRDAVPAYERFLAATPPPAKLKDKVEPAQKRVAEIKGMPGKVHLESGPPNATVLVDQKPFAEKTPTDLDLPPGKHTIRVEAEGFEPAEREVDVLYAATLRAEYGQNGQGSDCNGRAGKDLEIKVPQGTQVFDEDTDTLIVDLREEGQRFVVAKGGRGGRGNIHFATPFDPAPRRAEPDKASVFVTAFARAGPGRARVFKHDPALVGMYLRFRTYVAGFRIFVFEIC